jgi:ribonuclease HI
MESTNLTLYCDGACLPVNPGGYACYGWIAYAGDETIAQGTGCLGHGPGMTNNRAEYAAVLAALQWATAQGYHGLTCYTDNLLVVRQVEGEFVVRASHLVQLTSQVRILLATCAGWLQWVSREQNTVADRLSRQAYEEARKLATILQRGT